MGQNHRGSRVGVGYKGGEIVEVEGGHIVRSTGRKDRHSKVCTAKGPRDRRVRLSAHTAIQFYDVQDRLGYDRPSKAVDWLIKKAKAAIDELDELPAWQPIIQSEPEDQDQEQQQQQQEQEQEQFQYQQQPSVGMREEGLAEQHVASSSSSSFDFQSNPHLNPSSNFLPPSLESDAIADTIKSFFPASSSTIHFQNYPPDLLSRTNSQDLRLSLQSFHDPMLFQHHQDTTALNHHHQHHHDHHQFSNTTTPSTVESLMLSTFAGESAAATGGGGGIWSWNNADAGGIHVYNPLPLQISQNQFFTQRGPLQSSYSPLVRARTPPVTVAGGFSGFRIPARIQGEEEQDSIAKQQSSASSASRH